MVRKYLFICWVNSSGCYMNSELLDPFKLSQLSQSLPTLPNTLNKLNTSKVSDCPGSYMSKGVGFKN